MSFSSLEAGHASSAGAADYPLRTLERDRLEREMQRELEAWLDRAEGQSGPPDPTDEDLADWLRSDDSPLLLHNVEEFVLDPEAHLRAIVERVEGPEHAPQFSGGELVGGATPDNQRDRAEDLRARLRAVADLDAERILATPRHRGTPKGKTRTHYMWLVSPDRNISNGDLKRLILEIIQRRWPGAMACGYIHRDTDNTHLHIWLSAETLSGKKISVTRVIPSGDAILDKYPDLDEEVARSVSRHFGDPSIYEDHIARKLEWVHWRERFEVSLGRGEGPPVMPHRARHDYDWVGERRAVSGREGGESRPHISKREKAAPVPRVKSVMGALELWGKTVHLDARVKYRKALLESLDVWRDRIDYPVEGVKQSLELRLEEAEGDYERYRDAFEKTLENRARKGYPELKYPLHNSKQIAEMTEIARLTRDAELLRHVRSYTNLDRPTDSEGQAREIGSRWRDHIEARLEVLERADMLIQVAMRPRVSTAMRQAGAASDAEPPPFDRDREIVKGWLDGGWTPEQKRDSLPCFETEAVRLHAARYLKAREFFVATGEALAEWHERGVGFAARPALEESHLDRISRLVSGEGARISEHERVLLLDLARSAGSEREWSLRETTRLLESSLTVDAGRGIELSRLRGVRGGQEVFRPHEDGWTGRLACLLTLRETEALALAVNDASRDRFETLREEVYVKRELMELTRAVRASSGTTHVVPADLPTAAEERALERHLQAIADGLRLGGEGWVEWQSEGGEEFKVVLPAREQQKAVHIVEEVNARLGAERRVEALERLEPQLELATQFYVRAAYHDEGLEAMREPARLNDHVHGLSERLSKVARDAGYEPEQLGLASSELEVRAGRAISDAVERFGREEREAREIGRLEARMILACAIRDEAAARLQRFDDHSPFYNWNYHTFDGRESTSLFEVRLACAVETDRVALHVAENIEPHIDDSISEVRARLSADETLRAGEADAATRAYEARAVELAGLGVRTRFPVFEPNELARLEGAAVVTRDHELIALVASCEEEMYGPEYAAARSLGRSLRAIAVAHAEHTVPEKFEYPVAARQLTGLPGQERESLSLMLDQHRAAREAERAAALSFRVNLETQAVERAGEVVRTPRQGPVRPLLTEAEAREVFGLTLTMSTNARRSWEQKTMRAEVAVEGDKSRETSLQSLYEWARQNIFTVNRGSEYERSVGDTMLMSYSEAKAIIRQQNKELGRDDPSQSRGRQ